MFSKGEKILYNPSGVCLIADIREEEFIGEEMEYYILKQCFKNESTIYVPVENDELVARMEPLLSPDEVQKLMTEKVPSDVQWISDSKQRTAQYGEIISGKNRADMIQIIRLLLKHKEDVASTNHKFYASDEKLLGIAKKLIGEEFATVLSTTLEDVFERMKV